MANKKSKKQKRKKTLPVGWKKDGKNYLYYFKPKIANTYKIKKIDFIGFEVPPKGLNLYGTGGGFNMRQANKVGGSHFLASIENKYKKQIHLTIFSNGNGSRSFKILNKNISISLSFENFSEVIKDLGYEIKANRDKVVIKRLANFFPKELSADQTSDSAGAKLGDINLNALDEIGHEAVADFIKKYISLNAENNEVLEKLQTNLVLQGQKKTLDQVIAKFESRLKDDDLDEKDWQKFLHEEVFFFLSNYVESIRETNVSFGMADERERKPDFVWIDLYGFLDVFEIKTPQTEILAKKIDDSHDNYYFSRYASMAISQIEKYMLYLERNIDNYQKYLSRQTKIPFSVLKPKAFLIIGNTKEFETNEKKKRDFRVLRRLFKNIEFITFDELLDNLKNLASKFEKEKK